jgi:hypothetical protein
MGRIFGFLSVIIVMAAGMYIYSRQAQSSSAALGANSPKAAINITGVRTDLLTIAQAERGYFALEGKYASLDELISSRSLTVARQRPPYAYEVETGGSGFRVVATRTTADDGSGTPAELSVDENMQFQSAQ